MVLLKEKSIKNSNIKGVLHKFRKLIQIQSENQFTSQIRETFS